jgi:hypothetical protein
MTNKAGANGQTRLGYGALGVSHIDRSLGFYCDEPAKEVLAGSGYAGSGYAGSGYAGLAQGMPGSLRVCRARSGAGRRCRARASTASMVSMIDTVSSSIRGLSSSPVRRQP